MIEWLLIMQMSVFRVDNVTAVSRVFATEAQCHEAARAIAASPLMSGAGRQNDPNRTSGWGNKVAYSCSPIPAGSRP